MAESNGASGAAVPTAAQTDLIKKVQGNLIAPCCYTQSIDLHESEIAQTMRAETTAMVLAGQTALQIFGHYKAIYGERILMVPDGALGQIAAAVPVTAATVGSGLVMLALWKIHQRKKLVASQPVLAVPVSASSDALRERIRHEVDGDLYRI